MTRLRQIFIGATVTVTATGFLLIAVCGYRATKVSLHAEMTQHAYYLALELLTVFVREHPEAWPRGWYDLVGVSPRAASSVFRWPADLEEIRNRVYVDFNLNRADVAAMQLENFTAVKQVGPNYGVHEWRIKELLDAVRAGAEKDKGDKSN